MNSQNKQVDYAKLYEKVTANKEPVDLIEKQKFFEIKYNKKQRRHILREVLEPCLQPLLEQYRPDYTDKEQEEFNFTIRIASEILAILVERQTVTMTTLIEMVIERDEVENALAIADVVELGYAYGLWNITKDRHTRIHNVWKLSDEILHQLEEFRFLNPMIVKPLPVNQRNDNRGSGYLTIGSDSLLMGGNYHKRDICTEVLDKLNDTAFELNIELMRNYRNSWSSMNEPKKADGIDRMKDETASEFKERVQAFERFEQLVFKSAAEIYNSKNQCYLTHKYDKRGRIYCVGYQISYQSNAYAKAILNFKNKQLVTDTIKFFED